MYKPVNLIEVSIWGQRVGAVALDSRTNFYAFEYDRAWQRQGIELAPLTMPVSQAVHIFPSLPQETFKRLPSMLADALPDDFGNALIDAYMVREGVSQNQITPLDRLAYMSNRSMGALEFKPGRGPRKIKPTAVDISQLVLGSRLALEGAFDGDAHTQAAILNLIQVGTSAGGARAKAVIAWNAQTKEIRSGQLPAQTGFEHWLIKLDGVGKDKALGVGTNFGRIEYAYYLMATHAGIHMTQSQLLEENGRAHFMTRRFDRNSDQKQHMQTLCAMQHLDYKQIATHDYSQYLQTVLKLGAGDAGLEQAFRRMVFNVLAANCDDHTKNQSFVMQANGRWGLSPAYDITHSFDEASQWLRQHLMSVNGKFKNITLDDFKVVADRFMVPNFKRVIADVRGAVADWEVFASKANLPLNDVVRIRKDFVDSAVI